MGSIAFTSLATCRKSCLAFHFISTTKSEIITNRQKSSPAMADVIKINRAPVLTLWAAVVAERLGFDWEEAQT